MRDGLDLEMGHYQPCDSHCAYAVLDSFPAERTVRIGNIFIFVAVASDVDVLRTELHEGFDVGDEFLPAHSLERRDYLNGWGGFSAFP